LDIYFAKALDKAKEKAPGLPRLFWDSTDPPA